MAVRKRFSFYFLQKLIVHILKFVLAKFGVILASGTPNFIPVLVQMRFFLTFKRCSSSFPEGGDPYFGTDFGFDFGPWFVRFRYGFGPWFVRLRSVVRTVSVRFRSVVRTVSVRCSYGFGPWFLRFRSVVRTVSVRGSYGFGTVSFRGSCGSVRFRSVVRTARYGFVPWFGRFRCVLVPWLLNTNCTIMLAYYLIL